MKLLRAELAYGCRAWGYVYRVAYETGGDRGTPVHRHTVHSEPRTTRAAAEYDALRRAQREIAERRRIRGEAR